jgi:hypothetical protein
LFSKLLLSFRLLELQNVNLSGDAWASLTSDAELSNEHGQLCVLARFMATIERFVFDFENQFSWNRVIADCAYLLKLNNLL